MRNYAISLMLSGMLACVSPMASADIAGGYQLLETAPSEAAPYFMTEFENVESSADAAFILGMMHYEGIGIAQDQRQAIEWLERAASLQHPQAMFNLGILRYKQEIPVTGDIGDETLFQAAMALGDYRATMMRAIEMLSLSPKEYDPLSLKIMMTRLEEALDAGNPTAALILGIYHSEASWLSEDEKDFVRATAYLERSFSEGVIPAAFGLIALYESGGYGLKANPEKAQHYQTIIQDISTDRQLLDPEEYLPKPYSIWSLMRQDENNALISRLETAVSNSDSQALLTLIDHLQQQPYSSDNHQKLEKYRALLVSFDSADILYKRGIESSRRVNDEGWKLIESAATKGYLPAIKWLADSRHWGWSPDRERIATYQKLGADLGDTEMIYDHLNTLLGHYEHLPSAALTTEIVTYAKQLQAQDAESVESLIIWSILYRDGIGVDKDPQKVFSLRKKAVEIAPDDVVNQMSLARFYYHGYGTAVDKGASAKHYLAAQANLRNTHTLENLTPTRYKNVTESLIRLHHETLGFAEYPALQQAFLKAQFETTPETMRAAKILDQLLDDLVDSFKRGAGGMSEYSYLLKDRDFAQYHAAKSANKPLKTLDRLKRKIALYEWNTQNNDRAKLYALRMYSAEMSDNQARLEALNSADADNAALQAWLTKEIESDIKSILQLLERFEVLMTNPEHRSKQYEKNLAPSHLEITDAEQAEALEIIMQLIPSSSALQQWVGTKLLPGNATLKQAFEALANEGHTFAAEYLAQ